jgi:hypothetical protein
MRRYQILRLRTFVFLAVLITAPALAYAQSDEIQVYDGALAPVGIFNLTWHNNYTPKGLKDASCAQSECNTSDKSLNGVTEWALGVTPWFEAGLYLPLYSIDRNLGAVINGGKIRLLFAVPNADERKFFYGSNFEFSYNAKHWDPKRFSSEIRPIIGWHLKPWDIIFNPIFDTEYDGIKNLEFVPASRIAYNINGKSAVALEEYADFGPIHEFAPVRDQAHQLFGVVDHSTDFMDIEFGVGVGLTDGSDKWQLKLILSRDLNATKGPR